MRELRARSSVVSHQAVYDVLAALAAAGLVRRIEPAGFPALYERRDYHRRNLYEAIKNGNHPRWTSRCR